MLCTSWNEEEDIALRRLPWRARIVYLQGIRRFMDYQTGWSGKSRVLSYRFFIELLEATDRSTSPDPSVTKDGLRAIFQMLERVGLVEWPRGSSSQKGVFFRCLLASSDQSVQKQDAPKTHPRRTQQDAPIVLSKNASCSEEDAPKTHPCCTYEDAPPPVSGIPEDKRVAKATVEPAFGRLDLARESAGKVAPLNGATKPVMAVFDYWRVTLNHPLAILDNKRSRVILARLKEGHSVEKLKLAVDGCKASPWHQGKNNRQTVYDDIELICRDAKHVEEFVSRVSGKSNKQQELEEWINHDSFIEGECSYVQA